MNDRLTVEQFGAQVKAKYPQYASYSDSEIGQKMLVKYPTYQAKIAQTPAVQTADQTSAKTYGASFPANTNIDPNENSLVYGLKEGAKTAGNLISSGVNLVKGVGSAIKNVFNPDLSKNTLSGIGNAAIGGVQKAVKATTGFELPATEGVQKANQTFDALKGALAERYGGLDKLQRTATNDPVGFATDVLSIIDAGAGAFGKTAEVNNALGKVADVVTAPIEKAASAGGNIATKTTNFAISKATGLNPETLTQIKENPAAFTKDAITGTTRPGVAGEVKTAIDSKIKDLADTGQGYQSIREGNHVATVDPTQIANVLDKHGIKVIDVPDGEGGVTYKVKTNAESIPLSPADKTQLENFLNTYGKEPSYTGNSFLNTRSALSDLSKYDATKTGNLQKVSRDLRGVYDAAGKEQIPGLKQLDETYAPQVQELKQIKKDYLGKDGNFKDGAVNKIANLTGKGKDQVLGRLEQIVPGITQKIKTLKAVEDIQAASGFKVGTYERGVAAAVGVAHGNIPLIASAILAQPEIAVPLIRGYGLAKPEIAKIINTLKTNIGELNNFQLPSSIQNMPAGLSTKAITPELVASKIDAQDLGLIRDYLKKDDLNTYMKSQHLMEHMQIAGMTEPVQKRFLQEVVDLSTKKLPVKAAFKSNLSTKGSGGLFTGSKTVSN